MTAADSLFAWLESAPSAGAATVIDWRCDIVQGEGVRVGIRDSAVGGPYEGPGLAIRLAGSLDLHWSDGRITRTGLDRRAVLDPVRELEAWRAEAVSERRGHLPPLAGPTEIPVVDTFDPSIADAAGERAATCLTILERLLSTCSAASTRRVDAVMRCSVGERSVATSRGFRADWRETACTIDLWADEIASESYGRRCLPTDNNIEGLANRASELATAVRSAHPLPAMARGVLFTSKVEQELLERFLLPNLSGRAIRDGRSPFSRPDLAAGRQAVRSDLDLTIDTTLPFELATAPCSSEGVPAGRVRLIAGGRLSSPTLDLATAADLGLPPTPAPRGRPAAKLTSTLPAIGLAEALSLLGDGVVVRDLPGLHTQAVRRGTYALVAPDAQVVAAGGAKGRCSVRIAGGLLDHLSRPSSCLVRFPGDLDVGLLVLTGVELLPA